jgi:hypothetical protein
MSRSVIGLLLLAPLLAGATAQLAYAHGGLSMEKDVCKLRLGLEGRPFENGQDVRMRTAVIVADSGAQN